MTETRMPALFVGHGSPMNALEDTATPAVGKHWAAACPNLRRYCRFPPTGTRMAPA